MADLPNNPNNREEEYLAKAAGLPNGAPDNPWSRKEAYLDAIDGRMDDIDTHLGGLSFVALTQAEYDALATKDANTLYIIKAA